MRQGADDKLARMLLHHFVIISELHARRGRSLSKIERQIFYTDRIGPASVDSAPDRVLQFADIPRPQVLLAFNTADAVSAVFPHR